MFTTNYDTLLERTRAAVVLQHYDVVVKKEDLLYARGPRIVKLHGSFPSPPFVITEEDYRRYPIDQAPFVNTVRQSLLENTLCLIGFSGDDPNFLQWIGWLRDHVGRESAPKIYLVGVLHELGEADRRLLDGRGIVTVDLSAFSKVPGEALSAFFDYLRCRRPRAVDWPPASEGPPSARKQCSPQEYGAIVAEWRRQREIYPGWIVVPKDRREVLWRDTQDWLWHLWQLSAADRAKLETPLDLNLAFELTWRLDRCLFPLGGELPAFLEEVATKYAADDLRLPEHAGWTHDAVFEAVANIRLWLLRHYREEGQDANWERVRELVEPHRERLLPEQRARYQLEEALQALFRFDPAEARRRLMEWQTNEHLPFWEAKRAALMAELGEAAAARPLLEDSLFAIRKQIGLEPVTEDLTLVSQESVAMLLLWAVDRGMGMTEPKPEREDLQTELSERWIELTRYKCDPRNDLESFALRLRHQVVSSHSEGTTPEFDLGVVSNTMHFGPDREAIAAYGLLRIFEDLGMPYRVERLSFLSESIKATLPRVGPYSPHWALVNIVRLGNTKAVDRLFDREFLGRLGRGEVDGYFETYLAIFERAVRMVDEPDSAMAKTFEPLAETFPEVFSRLCYKCSPAYRERLVGTLQGIYRSRRRRVFGDVGLFAHRLFDSMSVSERIRVVPLLIELPVPENYGEIDAQFFVNPIFRLKLPLSVRGDAIAVTEESVDGLLERLSADEPGRDWAATSLAWLHERGKLNGRQSDRFGHLLWKGVGEDDVPVVPGFLDTHCMKLPFPTALSPEPRVKKRLLTMLAENVAHTWGSRLKKLLRELGCSTEVMEWSEAEASDLLQMLSGWWSRNRYRLHRRTPMLFDSPAEQAKEIVDALSAVFSTLPGTRDDGSCLEALGDFVADLREHGIPVTRLEVVHVKTLTAERQDVLRRVAEGLREGERDRVVDALVATTKLAEILPDEARTELEVVTTKLVEGIEWRHRTALADRLRFTARLVDDHPWFLSEKGEAGLLHGLAQIAVETSTGVKGNDIDGVITIRAAAAALAFALFRRHEASGLEPPEEIRRWQELCREPDEFAEVRNAWTRV